MLIAAFGVGLAAMNSSLPARAQTPVVETRNADGATVLRVDEDGGPLVPDPFDKGAPPVEGEVSGPIVRIPRTQQLAETRWYERVVADLKAREYQISPHESKPSVYQAPNRAHGFRTYFREEGLRLVPRTSGAPDWTLGLRLTGYGRSGTVRAPPPPQLTVEGNRAEYRRPELIEWYENSSEGLEQGFTISSPPPGRGKIVLELEVSGSLRTHHVSASPGSGIEWISPNGQHPALRYGSLQVRDAAGRNLPARVQVAEDTVRIVLSDREARYPITVDPRITSGPADWWDRGPHDGSWFGAAVDGAGDVNGDGYDDVIIGAPEFDGGTRDEGAAFLYYGSDVGLEFDPAWSEEGNLEDARFGASGASAGDVNGDGYSDVVIGAPEANLVRVYHGSPDGLSAVPDWMDGIGQELADFGDGVDSAGDVNGDGYDDLMVSAPWMDFGGKKNAGRVWVWYGSEGGLPSSADWAVTRDKNQVHTGAHMASAGDVNGDGYDDVLVNTNGNDPLIGGKTESADWVFYGSSEGLPNSPSWAKLFSSGSTFPWHVFPAGDLNADTYDDVIALLNGYIFFFPGSQDGLAEESAQKVDREDSDFRTLSALGDTNGDGFDDIVDAPNARVYRGGLGGLRKAGTLEVGYTFGGDVSPAGDLNGDGLDDVISGWRYSENDPAGVAWAHYGTADPEATVSDWRVDGDQDVGLFGMAAAGVGDVNSDGYEDVLVGASGYDRGQEDEGAAFLYLGGPGGPDVSPTWIGDPDQTGAWFGATLAGGDFNGDGYADVAVGAPEHDWESDFFGDFPGAGGVFVYLGQEDGLGEEPAEIHKHLSIDGEFGSSLAGTGDVNGDGYDDLLISTPETGCPDSEYDGRVWLYLGGDELPGQPAWQDCARTLSGRGREPRFGAAVAGGGDLNGDGFDDFLVGAPTSRAIVDGTAYEGRFYVYMGTSSLSEGQLDRPPFIGRGSRAPVHAHPDAWFGGHLDIVGDLDGDGYDDLVVAAHKHKGPRPASVPDHGRIWIYYGSEEYGEGGWTLQQEASNPQSTGSDQEENFGFSIAGIGDYNGDGLDDFAVGAPGYDGNLEDEGSVRVYFGRSVRPPNWQADELITGRQEGARFGMSLDGAGDVNGDGIADLVAGSPFFDVNDGRVEVFYGFPTLVGGAPETVVISEIMADPEDVPDEDGEWFEVFNPGDVDVDMGGWTVKDEDNDLQTVPGTVIVPARGFAVLCKNDDSNLNGGIDCDADFVDDNQPADFVIANENDELILEGASSSEVDRVEYDGGTDWPTPTAASMVFTGKSTDDNNDPANWAVATAREGRYTEAGSDLGSPGTNGTGQVLPVELVTFTARLDGETVRLFWKTASETRNAGFEVQRSVDSTAFREIARLEGAGTTSEPQTYRFTDERLPFAAERVAYRLRQIDIDGSASYSRVATVELGAPPAVKLHAAYPNPVRRQATIRYELPRRAEVHLALYDVLGRRVATLVNDRQEAGRKVSRLDVGNLASGVYLLRLEAGDAQRTQRLTVVH